MGENSGIEWCDHSMNFWTGCRKVRMGCANCYMFREQARYGRNPQAITRTAAANWRKPITWEKKAASAAVHARDEGREIEPVFVFASSWTDFFLPEADLWRLDAWRVIQQTRHLTWLILTKRAERIAECLPADWGAGYANVLLGATVEHAKYLPTLDDLMSNPAAGYFMSAEPLLDELDVRPWLSRLAAVFAGGETGPEARPCYLRYARRLRDQCAGAGVPFMWKQWGEFSPYYTGVDEQTGEAVTREYPQGGMKRVGAAAAGRVLDGRVWDGMPGNRL